MFDSIINTNSDGISEKTQNSMLSIIALDIILAFVKNRNMSKTLLKPNSKFFIFVIIDFPSS